MTWPPNNQIVVDCNVFKHLFSHDQRYNPDGHVTLLLGHLATVECKLLVDDEGVFRHEYSAHVASLLLQSEIGPEIAILRYWLEIGNQDAREVRANRQLRQAIQSVIIENERADRAYVYVSFANGAVLVSNDEMHVVIGPPQSEGNRLPRRDRLVRAARRHVVDGAEILLSREANIKRLGALNANP